ncbi:hypothetical protein B9479_003788 [Cryptococcus floricola]|uniref:NADH dehydrogenase [ubiquinone] iron-sulfur protein 5 n=1 Tax=Cryptococcus floricola TaxID=2591691 RepID=A0A5D3B052_9TREE|nr:hypothetical protein B9479_003788 [Cryptococcus floricola]
MASGFGYTGGRTRCFPFWQEFSKVRLSPLRTLLRAYRNPHFLSYPPCSSTPLYPSFKPHLHSQSSPYLVHSLINLIQTIENQIARARPHKQCYANADKPTDCIAPKDDYLECLHNTKEIARAKEVKAHFIQKELHSGSDARKAAEKAATGVVVSLGLVEGEEGK